MKLPRYRTCYSYYLLLLLGSLIALLAYDWVYLVLPYYFVVVGGLSLFLFKRYALFDQINQQHSFKTLLKFLGSQALYLLITFIFLFACFYETQLAPAQETVSLAMIQELTQIPLLYGIILMPWCGAFFMGLALGYFVFVRQKSSCPATLMVPQKKGFWRHTLFHFFQESFSISKRLLIFNLCGIFLLLCAEGVLQYLNLKPFGEAKIPLMLLTYIFCLPLLKFSKSLVALSVTKKIGMGLFLGLFAILFCGFLVLGYLVFDTFVTLPDYIVEAHAFVWFEPDSALMLRQSFLLFFFGWAISWLPVQVSYIAKFAKHIKLSMLLPSSGFLPLLLVLGLDTFQNNEDIVQKFSHVLVLPVTRIALGLGVLGFMVYLFRNVTNQKHIFCGELPPTRDVKARSLIKYILFLIVPLPFYMGGFFIIGWQVIELAMLTIGLFTAMTIPVFLIYTLWQTRFSEQKSLYGSGEQVDQTT